MRLPAISLLASLVFATASSVHAGSSPPPRLVVLISIDQFPQYFLHRFDPWFSDDGFRRLRRDGVEFTGCHYRYATTKTAPGHATISTGVNPNLGGIIANDWLDPVTFVKSEAVEDPDYPAVGAASPTKGRSPRKLLVDSVGDYLKASTGGRARVISIAGKDRSAILLGGHRADAAYWLQCPNFITSTYYMNSLPAWVAKFNAEGRVDAGFGKVWDRFLPEKEYQHLGPDDAPGEEPYHGLGTTFPHVVNGGSQKPDAEYYKAFETSPFRTLVMESFVELAVNEEHLGEDDVTDLLCIGFSQPDTAGHAYGPDSHEVFDSVVRLDRVLARFLGFLDAKVGKGNYIVVVSSDHGTTPLPERSAKLHPDVPAGRVDGWRLNVAVRAALAEKFGAPPEGRFWSITDNSGIRFDKWVLKERGVSEEEAAAVTKATLLADPEIQSVYTRAELLGPGRLDAFGEAERLSYHPDRSVDVQYVVKPWFVERTKAGTTHGTPHEYDNHVPFLLYGGGLKHAVHDERVGTDSIAPTISKILGIPTSSKTPSAL